MLEITRVKKERDGGTLVTI